MEKAEDSLMKKRLRGLPQKLDKVAQEFIDIQSLLDELSAEEEEILARYCAVNSMSKEEAIVEFIKHQIYIAKQCGFHRLIFESNGDAKKKRRA